MFAVLAGLFGSAVPSSQAQSPTPGSLEAYFPGTVGYAPGAVRLRVRLAFLDPKNPNRVVECRNVANVEWKAPGGRVVGTTDSFRVGVIRYSRPGDFTAQFLVRGGNCRGYRGEVSVSMVPLPIPIVRPPCRTACGCGGYCGPRRPCPERGWGCPKPPGGLTTGPSRGILSPVDTGGDTMRASTEMIEQLLAALRGEVPTVRRSRNRAFVFEYLANSWMEGIIESVYRRVSG